MNRRIVVVLLALAMCIGLAAPVAAARSDSGRRPTDEYWTAERVRNATPRDIVLDGPAAPSAKPADKGKPPKDGGDEADPTPTGDVSGAPWVDNGEGIDQMVGRVLFTLGGRDYTCSASSVANPASGNWILLTAGHCVWDDTYKEATNWVFVPDYEDVLRFGCKTATVETASCFSYSSLHPTAAWAAPENDYVHDVAFVTMADSATSAGLDASTFPAVLETSVVGQSVQAFGYPAAKKYDGTDLIYCSGTAVAGPGSYSTNPALGCDMTGGSSGGPWHGTDADGNRVAVSLNSFGLRGYNGFMFGPVFDDEAMNALAAAIAAPVPLPAP